ncbi:MAG: ferritin [Calditrichia bacterium]
MLKETLNNALNKQIAMEAYASAYYLSIASWCEQKGYGGAAEFFYRQAEEEREHMMKFFRFVNEADGQAIVPQVDKPPVDFPNFSSLFETALDHERKVTASINSIMKLAYDEGDFRVQNLLQWFVDEQLEEEVQMQTLIDKLRLIGDNGAGLYMLDTELGQRAAAPEEDEAE